MNRRISFAAVALLLVIAGASRTDAAPTPLSEGTKAPDFDGKEFIHGEACSMRSLRGQVVFFEIFRTWCGPCKKAAPHLTELHEKYGAKGLKVIGITNEARGLVDKFIEDQGVRHMIVIESTNSGANYGTSSVPSPWLIGADGRILLKGMPSESQIEEALQKVRLAPTLTKTLEPLAKDVKKEKFGEVRAKVAKMLEATTLSADDRKSAEELRDWLEWQAESALADAKADSEKGDWYEASLTLERVKKVFAGHPAAADATEQLKAIQADKDKKDAVAAGKKLQAALEDQREKNLSPKEALPIFRAIEKKYGDTLAGKKAAAIVDALEADIAKKD